MGEPYNTSGFGNPRYGRLGSLRYYDSGYVTGLLAKFMGERAPFPWLSLAFGVSSAAFGAFSIGIRFHPGARAYQVAVAEHVVDAAHDRPELVVVQPLGWETGLLARIGVVPIFDGKHVRRVGGIL